MALSIKAATAPVAGTSLTNPFELRGSTTQYPFQGRLMYRILDEEGYLAEAEQTNSTTYYIHLFNCALHEIAHRFRQACGSELELIRTLLPEADVQREHYMMNGDASCSYRISVR